MTRDDDRYRALIAARHDRLFDLLNAGTLQANRLRPDATPPGFETSVSDFLRDAVASVAPDRKPDWQR